MRTKEYIDCIETELNEKNQTIDEMQEIIDRLKEQIEENIKAHGKFEVKK